MSKQTICRTQAENVMAMIPNGVVEHETIENLLTNFAISCIDEFLRKQQLSNDNICIKTLIDLP